MAQVLTALSARFAAPWGHHDPVRLARELTEAERGSVLFPFSGLDLRYNLHFTSDSM